MKLTPTTIPERKRAVRSVYYDLVTALIDAYLDGKAINVDLASDDRVSHASVAAHLKHRLKEGGENFPPLKISMKRTGPLSMTLWLIKKKDKP